MSDTSGGQASEYSQETQSETAREPLWQRLLYMLGFWFLGNIAFSVCVFLGAIQFVVILLTNKKNEDLARFSRNLARYVWDCLGYIVFAHDEKPFPLGRFPDDKPVA